MKSNNPMNILEGFELYEGNSDKTVWEDNNQMAASLALDKADVIDAVHQTISRALSFAQANLQDDTYAIRINWFATYSDLTITYGSEDWYKESPHMVKCSFGEMDSLIWGGMETFFEAKGKGEEVTTIQEEDPLYYLDMIQAGITHAIENPIINKVLLRLREMNIGLYYYEEEDYENAKRIF